MRLCDFRVCSVNLKHGRTKDTAKKCLLKTLFTTNKCRRLHFLRRRYWRKSFYSIIQPKRIQAEPCTQLKAGGEGTDPVIAGLLGPEVTKVQKKLFILALQAVCQLLLQFLDSGSKLRCAAVLSVCKGLRIERSKVKLFDDIIHRFSPPLRGTGRPSGAD